MSNGDTVPTRRSPGSLSQELDNDCQAPQTSHTGDASWASAIRVLLVDDHPVVRAGLRAALERFRDIRVAVEAGDGATAVELAKAAQPDVAVLDLAMPDLDGIETATYLRAVSPRTRTALMSGAFDARQLERGLAAGVHGFILKTEEPSQFAAFITELHRDGYCCSEDLATRLIRGPQGFEMAPRERSRLGILTERERVMLIELAKGASLKQAALEIGISYKSADHLKQNIMKKLNVHDRVELVRLAIREGLIS